MHLTPASTDRVSAMSKPVARISLPQGRRRNADEHTFLDIRMKFSRWRLKSAKIQGVSSLDSKHQDFHGTILPDMGFPDAEPAALVFTVHPSRWRRWRRGFSRKPSGAMRAIDTNVVVRYLTGGDPSQAGRIPRYPRSFRQPVRHGRQCRTARPHRRAWRHRVCRAWLLAPRQWPAVRGPASRQPAANCGRPVRPRWCLVRPHRQRRNRNENRQT